MTLDEKNLYLASIAYDVDALLKSPVRDKDFVFDKEKLYDTISAQTSLFDEVKDEVLSLMLRRQFPYSVEGNTGRIRINKNEFIFDVSRISLYFKGFKPSSDFSEDTSFTLENFPLRANVLLNDVFLDFPEHKKDEVSDEARSAKLHLSEEDISDEKEHETDPVITGITADKLILTVYRISYPEDNGDNVMTVIIAPLISPSNGVNRFSIPVFALAKMNGKIATGVSLDNRASVLLSVGGESVTLKGTWAGDKFKTFVYPQHAQGRTIKIIKSEYCPKHPDGIGHSVISEKDEIHILPMSTKNNKNGYVQFIVCIKELLSQGNVKNTVGVAADGKNFRIKDYMISCRWEEESLQIYINGQKQQNKI